MKQQALFNIRDARAEDMVLVDFYAQTEGMDSIPGYKNLRVAVNDNDEVVGFCRIDFDELHIAYVSPIVVNSEWRGYGVGRALIADASQKWGELRLIARGTSEAFYRALGFADMSWDEVDLKAASEDCFRCPYRSDCKPCPMRLASYA